MLFDSLRTKCRSPRRESLVYDIPLTVFTVSLVEAHHSVVVPHDCFSSPFGFVSSFAAAVIPLFLVVMFEVAYAVHKRRSVKFCGIVFDVR